MICGDKQGTTTGYHRHHRAKDLPPCEPCRAAIAEYTADRYRQNVAEHPDATRNARIKHRFNMLPEEWAYRLATQEGRCAICGTDNPGRGFNWSIDHDHACCPTSRKTCGKCTRGLLCHKCNMGLGCYNDSPELLAKAIAYIEGGGHHPDSRSLQPPGAVRNA